MYFMNYLNTCFKISSKNVVFPNNLKIARVISLFKYDDPKNVKNYRPTYVFPCLFKILERIIYNCLYYQLNDGRILHTKQFDFQAGYSTEHDRAVKLTDHTHE